MKKCTKCHQLLEKKDFYLDNTRPDKLQSRCKQCARIIRKKWYLKNREYDIARAIKWQLANKAQTYINSREYRLKHKKIINKRRVNYRKKNLEKYREYGRVYYANNKVKSKARGRVKWLIANGIIKKEGCAYPNGKCEGRIEAHHWDYSKPENVVFFCKKHHGLADQVYKLIEKYHS